MIGKLAAQRYSCEYGCCTPYGKPCKRNLRAVKRSAKRREARAWRRENNV